MLWRVREVHGWGYLLRPHRLPPAVAYRLRRALDSAPPRATNAYATHVPVLVGLARMFKIRSVLEFGSGTYSTLTFLDRRAFPDLERIDSYETDGEWLRRVEADGAADMRLSLRPVTGLMAGVAAIVDINDYDLVLIDDSVDEHSRAATIHEIARRATGRTTVAIHDFEVIGYRRAAEAIPHRFAFTALNPQTGVCWREPAFDVRHLKRLNAVIARHSRQLEPDDRASWLKLYDDVGLCSPVH